MMTIDNFMEKYAEEHGEFDVKRMQQAHFDTVKLISDYENAVGEEKMTVNVSNGIANTLKNMFPSPAIRSAFVEMALRKELQRI
jgi:hypothetical protein